LAYAAAAYLRIEYNDDRVKVYLVCAKKKLVSLKRRTIPQIELLAAHRGSMLAAAVGEILKIKDIHFWSDSTCVLGWLKTPYRRYTTFISTRVTYIYQLNKCINWHHVPTELNPADKPTRGMTIDELINCELWFEGPPFLKLAKEEWPVITRKLTPEEQKVIDDKVVNFALNIHVNEKDYTRSHNKNSGNFYNKLHHKINNEEFWWKRIKLEHHFENKSFKFH
jgi:hypothetical protein